MRSVPTLSKDRWTELMDRDLDRLFDGRQPVNDYLAPLESFVNSLRNLGAIPISPEFLKNHVAQAANAAKAAQSTVPELTTGRKLALGLKRRVAASATSLMMIVGMTGVAVASDSAVPGDWNYGIDRALEAVGIGEGGAAERLQELAAIRKDGHPRGSQFEQQSDQNRGSPPDGSALRPDIVGREKAPGFVAEITDGRQGRPAVDPEERAKPEQPGRPAKPEQPDGPAKPEQPDRPAKPEQLDRPAKPGELPAAGRP